MVEHKILFDDDADALVESNLHVSPAEILEKEFAQRFRGYDVHQVDAFLEDVAKELERISKEYARLKEEVDILKEELAVSREKERSLHEELLVAQTMGDDIRDKAEQEASRIVSGAQLDAQKVMAEVRQQCASLQQEITAMNQKREQFETSLRSLLEGYLNTLGK
jgi:cell division initiation protein